MGFAGVDPRLCEPIRVLDKGYVRLTRITAEVNEDGTLEPAGDLAPVNDARASFDRRSERLDERDEKLLNFLGRNEHTSPFRGVVLQLEIKAPLMIARQAYKYCVGSDHDETMASRDPFFQWNEVSRRYVTGDPEFYVPGPFRWRGAPENRKQGSSGTVDASLGDLLVEMSGRAITDGLNCYKWALEHGVCAEQARMFLPAYAMYTTWRWTSSLQGICHVLTQRLAHDAQSEFTAYARAIDKIVTGLYPLSREALVKEDK